MLVRRINIKGITVNAPLLQCFSSTNDAIEHKEVIIYKAKYANKMKWLRRMSLGSTVLSLAFMPAAIMLNSDVVPLVGQVAIAGTVFFTSISSTIMLQVVAHPYVCTLSELIDLPKDKYLENNLCERKGSSSDRKFKAVRLNFLGNSKTTEFTLGMAKKSDANPFASFHIDSAGFFYVFGKDIKDDDIKKALTV